MLWPRSCVLGGRHKRKITHSLTHSRIHALPHSLTPSRPHSLTPSLMHARTRAFTHSLTYSLTLRHKRKITQSSGLPGTFYMFEMSPMQVSLTEVRQLRRHLGPYSRTFWFGHFPRLSQLYATPHTRLMIGSASCLSGADLRIQSLANAVRWCARFTASGPALAPALSDLGLRHHRRHLHRCRYP